MPLDSLTNVRRPRVPRGARALRDGGKCPREGRNASTDAFIAAEEPSELGWCAMAATSTTAEPAREPCGRGVILRSLRAAAREMWGDEGLRIIAANLADEVRAATLDHRVTRGDWLPERYVVAWHEAVWTGPAKKDDRTFRTFMDRTMDIGWGRIRRLFLRFLTPIDLFAKAEELWKDDHTHGELRFGVNRTTLIGTLHDHPYATSEISRRAIAEVFRYALTMTRATNVREHHSLHGTRDLLVQITWE